jgi:hypothetical protein
LNPKLLHTLAYTEIATHANGTWGFHLSKNQCMVDSPQDFSLGNNHKVPRFEVHRSRCCHRRLQEQVNLRITHWLIRKLPDAPPFED